MKHYRDTWVEVDLDAIAYNVRQAKKLHPNKVVMAVVKANGYGHGDIEVATAALDAGAEMLAVSSLDEAFRLRDYGMTCKVLNLGVTNVNDVLLASKRDISITAHDKTWIMNILDIPLTVQLHVHLKIDTGMHRIGLTDEKDVKTCFNLLSVHRNIKVEGIYTHMATADCDHDYFHKQVAHFQNMTQQLDLSNVTYIHLANSATTLQFDVDFTNAVRFGISMYGVNPGGDFIPLNFDLKPTLGLYSRLSQVKKLKKGDKVGYGATYEAKEEVWLGVIPIGYADGWIRAHQGRHVVVDGYECEIIGRICMDQMMIRLPKELPIGTLVTLIGDGMPASRVAKEMGTIEYEIFCLISDRISRLYKVDDKIIKLRRMRFD